MKNKLLLFLLIFLSAITLKAQNRFFEKEVSSEPMKLNTPFKPDNSRASIIGDDSYYYWENNSRFTKELNTFLGTTGYANGGFDTLLLYTYTVKQKTSNGTYWQSLVQGISNADTLSLNNIYFIGKGLKSGGSNVVVKVLKDDFSTVLATKTISVSNTYGYKNVVFDSPVTYNSNMYVTFEMATVADSFQVAKSHSQWNNYNFGTPGVFTSALPFVGDAAILAVNPNNAGILGLIQENFDFFVIPNFTYKIKSNFSASKTNLCLGDSVSFTNNGNTSHVYNPILNYLEWDYLANGYAPVYTNYNFGNGTGLYSETQQSGVKYGAIGQYNVKAKVMIWPWTMNIIEDSTLFVIDVRQVAATATVSEAIACNGGSGKVFVNATGGFAPYADTGTVANVIAGTYDYMVTDANGCTSNTVNLTVNEPAAISVTTATAATSICGGTDGTATASVNGGSTYSYLWTPSNQNTSTAIGLSAGSYSVLITDIANGCQTTKSATVADGGAPTITITPTHVACFGGNTGSATITSSSDISAYTFTWSNTQSGLTISNLTPGKYTVSGTDGSCQINDSITITQPTALTATASSTNITCNGLTNGQLTVTAGGGTSPYSYSWTGTANYNTANVSTAGVGQYIATVTDSKGCTKSATAVTITEPTSLTATASSTNITCNGLINGQLTVTAGGGTSPYSYSWTGTANYNTASVSTAGVGQYIATVTDSKGCTKSATVVTISEPTALTATASSTNITCNGLTNGQLTVTAGGGTPSYSYTWTGTANYNTASVTTAGVGSYTATVTDSKGCTKSATIVTITQPNAISITGTVTDATDGLSNGAITSNVSGGTPSYSYSWNPAVGTSSTVSNIPSGNYILTITDTKGCTQNKTFVVNDVSTTCAIQVALDTIISAKDGLNNGAIMVYVTGNYGNVTYQWTPNAPNSPTIIGVTSGDYYLLVTDTMGCRDSITIHVSDLTNILESSITELSIYPNPVVNILNLSFSAITKDATIKLISLTGEVLANEIANNSNGTFYTSINMNGYASGIYFLQINSGENVITKKIIRN